MLNALSESAIAGAWIGFHPEAGEALLHGTPRERRRALNDIRTMKMTSHLCSSQLWRLLLDENLKTSDCALPTHEFVQVGKKGSCKKYKPFTLW